jgi:tetratricopeptide (TPR) repeat protein
VIYAGWEAHKAGEREKALQLLELAADLDPTNQDIARRQAWIVSPRGSRRGRLETLRAAAAAAPKDFRAQQALDYALAKQNRFVEVIAL